LALARAIERHVRGADVDADDERLFVELSGAYLGVLLCDALEHARHTVRGGRHGLQLGQHGFFDPFAAVERALSAEDVRGCLAEHVARAEAEASGDARVAARLAWERARTRIVPRMIGAAFYERLSSQAGAVRLCSRPLAHAVHIGFVLREPGRARYVSEAEAQAWQRDSIDLLQTSVRNLAAQSDRARFMRVEGELGTLVVAASGDGLDASRILLPGLHDVLAPELGSPFAVAIPHRDALFACALGSLAAVHALRERARHEAERSAHAITSQLFAVEPTRLAPLSV
jgi:hypothetical protein